MKTISTTSDRAAKAKRSVSRRIRSLLESRGMTVYEMSQKSGLPKNAIYRAWRGDSVPDAVLLIAIAKFFGVTAEFLLDD